MVVTVDNATENVTSSNCKSVGNMVHGLLNARGNKSIDIADYGKTMAEDQKEKGCVCLDPQVSE